MPALSELPAAGDAMQRRQPSFVTISAWCRMCGISTRTAYRLLKRGAGPKVTELSPRRIAIRSDHLQEWLKSQVRTTIEK